MTPDKEEVTINLPELNAQGEVKVLFREIVDNSEVYLTQQSDHTHHDMSFYTNTKLNQKMKNQPNPTRNPVKNESLLQAIGPIKVLDQSMASSAAAFSGINRPSSDGGDTEHFDKESIDIRN